MTKEAQNCLLKTLEEPPEFVVLILISSNENMILNTIKSRCMKVKFENIENNLLQDYAKKILNYDFLNENLINSFNGSIGKAISLKENQNSFIEIENMISKIEQEDIISILNDSKHIFSDKENIFDILDYMTVCMYSKSKRNKRYLNCLKYISEVQNRLKSNGNFDMNIDNLLLSIWEELNENSNWSKI